MITFVMEITGACLRLTVLGSVNGVSSFLLVYVYILNAQFVLSVATIRLK